MQVTGQNNIQPKTAPQPVSNQGSVPVVPQPQVCQPCSSVEPQGQNGTVQNCATNPVQTQYPQGYIPPQYSLYPQYQQPVQNQNYQVPATASGVNIQIFNPSVATPGAQAPTYNVNAPCYPSGYYTGNYGLQTPAQNIQQTNTNNINSSGGEVKQDTKTEKRKIVELTEDYIRNLEAHLNSQEKAVRINAAKEVFARLEEDDSRNDDKALTALVNKMLQDPCEEVRILALSALDGRICKGDDYTVNVLKGMQQSNNGYGQDAIDASSILLKMSGRQVEKEFEVKNNKDDKSKNSETKKSTIKENKKV